MLRIKHVSPLKSQIWALDKQKNCPFGAQSDFHSDQNGIRFFFILCKRGIKNSMIHVEWVS